MSIIHILISILGENMSERKDITKFYMEISFRMSLLTLIVLGELFS